MDFGNNLEGFNYQGLKFMVIMYPNVLKNFGEKDIRLLFTCSVRRRDLNLIEKMLFVDPELINLLGKVELCALIDYLISTNNTNLVKRLFFIVKDELRIRIISSLKDVTILFSDEEIDRDFNYFLKAGINTDNQDLLYKLAQVALNNPLKYDNELGFLDGYFRAIKIDIFEGRRAKENTIKVEESQEKVTPVLGGDSSVDPFAEESDDATLEQNTTLSGDSSLDPFAEESDDATLEQDTTLSGDSSVDPFAEESDEETLEQDTTLSGDNSVDPFAEESDDAREEDSIKDNDVSVSDDDSFDNKNEIESDDYIVDDKPTKKFDLKLFFIKIFMRLETNFTKREKSDKKWKFSFKDISDKIMGVKDIVINYFKNVWTDFGKKVGASDLYARMLLLTGNYETFIKIAQENKHFYSLISKKNTRQLLAIFKNNNNVSGINEIFDKLQESQKREAITFCYQNEFMNFDKDLLENNYDLFMDECVTNGYNEYILLLAMLLTANPEMHILRINKLRAYLLSVPIDEVTSQIAEVPGIMCDELYNKIMQSGNKADYFMSLRTEDDMVKFAVQFVESKPSLDIFKAFAQKTKAIMPLYKGLAAANLDFGLISEYLLVLFDVNKDVEVRKDLIEDIIYINNYEAVKKLMGKITRDEQETVAKRALAERKLSVILTLACVVKTPTAYVLAYSVIFSKNVNKISFMISNLEGSYLEHALKKLLDLGPQYYLEVLNRLQDLPNYKEVIDYIFTHNAAYLFGDAVAKNLYQTRLDLMNASFQGRK